MDMRDIKDIARYVGLSLIAKGLTVSPLKLQKLLYYVQSWYMVFNGRHYAEAVLFLYNRIFFFFHIATKVNNNVRATSFLLEARGKDRQKKSEPASDSDFFV